MIVHIISIEIVFLTVISILNTLESIQINGNKNTEYKQNGKYASERRQGQPINRAFHLYSHPFFQAFPMK